MKTLKVGDRLGGTRVQHKSKQGMIRFGLVQDNALWVTVEYKKGFFSGARVTYEKGKFHFVQDKFR